ncbi:aminotransferase class I/II-fold pyridoxal phosphate-dependent enzyme [Candidatus Vidania fulgoroideae]|uniref:Aminotransferase class I/II-fold pyridoxal phosphate-dependent enzyme n=1 Tax=Candidatus Vidania fulgoroideorum TaxID=881286 RepID=A0AAX3N8R3_9PROT|nr:aminotransferase class I/II-fold pyridoxal phosphate-dependent enzyme [Candidatus Vidania fulgoroideae]WDR79397.1 aminotransferase class I/II-fold pyridoxal phosphate-dependent enzyme [Candidatus Vidania fulgoroideae]
MKKITKLIHSKLDKKYFSNPITRASTIFCKKIKKNIKYGLEGTEINRSLENKINILEKSKYTSLYPSGLSAISNIYLSILKKNDIILLPDNVYKPNLRCTKWLSKIIGYKYYLYNKRENFRKFYNKKIKMIWIEAPGSITFEIPKIKKILYFSKKKNIISVFDNTYSSSIYNPLKDGFDISILALTKFYSGNNDLLMGSISINNKKINKKIVKSRKNQGIGVSFEDCFLINRSIFTIKDRILIHDKNSRKILKWIIKRHKEIIKKYYCPFKNNFFKKKIKYSSGLFTICFRNININKFINSLKLFKIGFSWGGVVSLIMKYKIKNELYVRFYTGLENYKDLIKDINTALYKSYY